MKNFKSLTVLFLSATVFGFSVSSAHAWNENRYAQIYTHQDEITNAASRGNQECNEQKEQAKQSCEVIRNEDHREQCLENVGAEFYNCKNGR